MRRVAVILTVYIVILIASATGEEDEALDKKEEDKEDAASESKIRETAVFAPKRKSSRQYSRRKTPPTDIAEDGKSESQVQHTAVVQVQEIHDEKDEGHHQEDIPQSYKFGYEVKDEYDGHQYRHEQKDPHGTIHGRFGYRDPKGQYRQVDYVADDHGFRANVQTNEPGVENQDPADVEIQKETSYESPEPRHVEQHHVEPHHDEQHHVEQHHVEQQHAEPQHVEPQHIERKPAHSVEPNSEEQEEEQYVPHTPNDAESQTEQHYGNQRGSASGHYPITLRPRERQYEHNRKSHARVQSPYIKGGQWAEGEKKGASAVVRRHFYKQHLTHHQHHIQHPGPKYTEGPPSSVQYHQLSRGNVAKVVTSLPLTKIHASGGDVSHNGNEHALHYPQQREHPQDSHQRYISAQEIPHSGYRKQQEKENGEYESYHNPDQEYNGDHNTQNKVQAHQYQGGHGQEKNYHEEVQAEERDPHHQQYEREYSQEQYANNDYPSHNAHTQRYKDAQTPVEYAHGYQGSAHNHAGQHKGHHVVLKIPLANYGQQETDLQGHYDQASQQDAAQAQADLQGKHGEQRQHQQYHSAYAQEPVHFPETEQKVIYQPVRPVETPTQHGEVYEVTNGHHSRNQNAQTYQAARRPSRSKHQQRHEVPSKSIHHDAHHVQYSSLVDPKPHPQYVSAYEQVVEDPAQQQHQRQVYAPSQEQTAALSYKTPNHEIKLEPQTQHHSQPYLKEHRVVEAVPHGRPQGPEEYHQTIELDPEIYNQLINPDLSKGHRLIAIPVLKQLQTGKGHKLLLVGAPQHLKQNEHRGKSEIVVEEVPVLVPSGQQFGRSHEKHGGNIILPQGERKVGEIFYKHHSLQDSHPEHSLQHTKNPVQYHGKEAAQNSGYSSLTPIFSKNLGSSHHLQIFLNPYAHEMSHRQSLYNNYKLAGGRGSDSEEKSKWIPIPRPARQNSHKPLPSQGQHYNTQDHSLSTGYSRQVRVILNPQDRTKGSGGYPVQQHPHQHSTNVRNLPASFSPFDGEQGLHGQISYASSRKVITRKNCNCKLKDGKLVPKY